MEWYLKVLKNYIVFTGRARRKEFWMFVLINFIILVVLGFIDGIIGGQAHRQILSTLYRLAVLLPTIAVGVRRMHDTDHSGWWLLLPIVNLIFAATEGTKGNNRFGSDPKAASQAA